jgi:hypothetical protein
MGLKTVFLVQPYWFDGRRLARGPVEQYRTLAEARRAAERLYLNHAGVEVFSVSGNPEFDAWRDPEVVWAVGKTLTRV